VDDASIVRSLKAFGNLPTQVEGLLNR